MTQDSARNAIAVVFLAIALVASTTLVSLHWALTAPRHVLMAVFVASLGVPLVIAGLITSADLVGRLVLTGTVVVGGVVIVVGTPVATTDSAPSPWATLVYPIGYGIVLAGWFFLKNRPILSYVAVVPYVIVAALLDVPKTKFGSWFSLLPYRHWAAQYDGTFAQQFKTNAWFNIDVAVSGVFALLGLAIALSLRPRPPMAQPPVSLPPVSG